MNTKEDLAYKIDTIYVRVIVPEKSLYSHVASSITLPGLKGEFTVLPNHAVLVSEVNSGVISIITDKHTTHKIFISKGFAQIANNSINVLVEHAHDVTDSKSDDINLEIENLKEKLKDQKVSTSELSMKIINKKIEFLNNAKKSLEEN